MFIMVLRHWVLIRLYHERGHGSVDTESFGAMTCQVLIKRRKTLKVAQRGPRS
jgi:hypothetical protein